MNNGIVPALLVYQLVRAERDGGGNLNGSQLHELTIKYLWLYLFGHIHYAWYFTWYVLQMRYLCLKTKAQLLQVILCASIKLQVVVCILVLSEQFDKQAGIGTGKDGLRWVIFSPENVRQLMSYHYMSGKLEYIYPDKQQDNSEKGSCSKHMEGDDARRRNAG